MTGNGDIAAGARNLLTNCAGIEPGQRLLIIQENPDLGWYDAQAPIAVAAEARKLGLAPDMLEVGAPGNEPAIGVETAVAAHDVIVFFSRLGDQDRFAEPVPGKTLVMSYARDAATLASVYGRTNHQAFVDLKEAVNDILLGAGTIDIRCPLGTAISGSIAGTAKAARADVSVRRFPLGVPQPVRASGFSGRVAVAHYLTPTGSKVYEPAYLNIGQPVFAEVASGRITGFTGDHGEVERIGAHYENISAQFGIDGGAIHSWHAGIHPGCFFPGDASRDPDIWSNTIFGNPRFAHFHTCGDYAPGEICWMVLDPTITVDGRILWDNGRLRADGFGRSRRCLEEWPELVALFANPSDQTGLPA